MRNGLSSSPLEHFQKEECVVCKKELCMMAVDACYAADLLCFECYEKEKKIEEEEEAEKNKEKTVGMTGGSIFNRTIGNR